MSVLFWYLTRSQETTNPRIYDKYINIAVKLLEKNKLRFLKLIISDFYLTNTGKIKEAIVIKIAIFLTILSLKTKLTDS